MQLGMSSALGTLCGQSYGAKQYHMLGVYLQRSWIVMFIASIFLLPLCIFTTPILKLLGQSDSMAYIGGEVGRWLISTLFAFIVSFTCQMYLQSQSKNMIITYLAAVTIVIHIFLSWLLTVKYKLGIPGAMLSTVFAFWIPNIGQLIYVMCGGCRDTWKGFSLLAFKDLWPVVKLSLSSGVMLCFSFQCGKFWYYTALVLITGYLKNSEVSIDALTICFNVLKLAILCFECLVDKCSVRVGNELRRGSSKAAKFSIVVTVFTSFVIGFVLFLFFLFLKGRLAYIFTENEEVVEPIADLSPLLAVSILLNSVQPVLSGVAVGAGWQSIVAYVNVVSYYIIWVPNGLVLGYVFDMGVKGVWMGMLFGTFVQTIVLVIVTYKTNWDEQVIVASNRVKKWAVDDAQEPKLTTSDVS
ncbi:hypothetical protein ACB092_09G158200 [Castanea dentata]